MPAKRVPKRLSPEEQYLNLLASGRPISEQKVEVWYGFMWIQTNVIGPWWYRMWVWLTRRVKRAR